MQYKHECCPDVEGVDNKTDESVAISGIKCHGYVGVHSQPRTRTCSFKPLISYISVVALAVVALVILVGIAVPICCCCIKQHRSNDKTSSECLQLSWMFGSCLFVNKQRLAIGFRSAKSSYAHGCIRRDLSRVSFEGHSAGICLLSQNIVRVGLLFACGTRLSGREDWSLKFDYLKELYLQQRDDPCTEF